MKIATIAFLLLGSLAIVTSQAVTTFLPTQSPAPLLIPRTFVPPTHAAPSHGDGAHATGPSATCIPTIVPEKNGYVPPGSCNANYNYYPSFGAAVAAETIFAILTIVQISQAIYYRKAFCWVIIMGCLWEAAAYISRILGTRNQQNINDLLFFQIFVLLAPLWLNAFDYMVLGRMIHLFIPTHSVMGIRASWLSVVFVLLDIGSFVIQLYGVTMTNLSSPPATILKGTHIYMGGIGLQQFFIIVFLGLAIRFYFNMLRLERNNALPIEKQNWRRLLYTLYASLFFITVRIIFRLVEFSAGPGTNNPIPYHEAYFYVFDAIPMSLAITAISVTHPGSVLYGPDSDFPKSQWRLKRAARKSLRRQEKEARKQANANSKTVKGGCRKQRNEPQYIDMLSDEEMGAAQYQGGGGR